MINFASKTLNDSSPGAIETQNTANHETDSFSALGERPSLGPTSRWGKRNERQDCGCPVDSIAPASIDSRVRCYYDTAMCTSTQGKDDRRTTLLAGKEIRKPRIQIKVFDILFVLVLVYTTPIVA
jgi:hypothetical protein